MRWAALRPRLAIAALCTALALLGIYQLLVLTAIPGPLVPFWLWLIAGCARRLTGLGRLLEHPIIVRLGEASYGLYLLHWPIWLTFAAVLGIQPFMAADADPTSIAVILVYVIVSMLVSLAVVQWVEHPLQRALRNTSWLSLSLLWLAGDSRRA